VEARGWKLEAGDSTVASGGLSFRSSLSEACGPFYDDNSSSSSSVTSSQRQNKLVPELQTIP
jgi:hypothetical protein